VMPPSSSVLYIETNYLWAIATGRDPDAIGLLKRLPAGLWMALPQICVMEAFSVLNATHRQRNQFRNSLDQQISQMRRDSTSPHARDLFSHLEQARIANDNLLEDINSRLFESMDLLAHQAHLIGLDASTLNESLGTILIEDPTDNLILHTILEDTKARLSDRKAFLSGNSKDFGAESVQNALRAADVKYFAEARKFLEWYESLPNT
jgi:hypothetical protein